MRHLVLFFDAKIKYWERVFFSGGGENINFPAFVFVVRVCRRVAFSNKRIRLKSQADAFTTIK